MSIAGKLEQLENDISDAYDSIDTMGGTLPTDKNTHNLATAIESIPSGGEPVYTKLDYIASSGTQYIDTGVVNTGTMIFELDCQITQQSNQQEIFGAMGTDTSTSSMLRLYTGQGGATNKLQYNYGVYGGSAKISYSQIQSGLNSSNRTKYIFGNGVFLYNYKSANISNTYNVETFSNAQSSLVFAIKGANGSLYNSAPLVKMRLYGLKITDNNVVLREFIPVRDSNNVVCLYDKVTKQFYYNAGTGNFTAGIIL